MGVGVEESILHHHPQVEARQCLHETGEIQFPRGEPIMETVHLGSRAVLHDQDTAPGELLQDMGNPHLAFIGEELPEGGHVLGLLTEVHLLPHPHRELPHYVGQGPNMVVGKEDVQPEEEAEGDV